MIHHECGADAEIQIAHLGIAIFRCRCGATFSRKNIKVSSDYGEAS